MIDIPTAATLLGVSYPQAREAVLRLEGADVLRPVTIGRKRNRAWEAPALLDLLDDFDFEAMTPGGRTAARSHAPKARPWRALGWASGYPRRRADRSRVRGSGRWRCVMMGGVPDTAGASHSLPWKRAAGRSLLADALSIVGLTLTVAVCLIASSDGFAYDAQAYWNPRAYAGAANVPGQVEGAFLYAPPALLVAQALSVIPWAIWLTLYTLAIGLGAWTLAGPLTVFVIFLPQVASEIVIGNIHVFLALVAVYGLRWPALWSFVLLTKVTPGIGLLWFAVRREWRSLGIALGVTAIIAIPTLILAPNLWADWLAMLGRSQGQSDGIPFPLRFLAATLLVVVGARRDWPIVLPVAVMLAQPSLWDVHGLAVLLGVLPYIRRLRFPRPSSPPAPI